MKQDEKPKRKTGRPVKSPEEGARINHAVRLRPSISEALKTAALFNDRTVSQELEHRIEQSFRGLHLDLSTEQALEITGRANANERTVEDEIFHSITLNHNHEDDLRSFSPKEFAEFIRTSVKAAASHLIAVQAWDYRPKDRGTGDNVLDGIFAETEGYKYAMRIVRWIELAEHHSMMLANIVDPDKRNEEDEKFKSFVDNIMRHEDNIKIMLKAAPSSPRDEQAEAESIKETPAGLHDDENS